ncbi:MAG: hypothetical protein IJQ81_03690 [Oscillibacter sp.]|nr:hypothetical protein [Oscillibacter sp.]
MFAYVQPTMLLNSLLHMTGFLGNDWRQWNGILSMAFREVKQLGGLINYRAPVNSTMENLCIFDSGMTTTQGREIYAVLMRNLSESYQEWELKELYSLDSQNSIFAPILEDIFLRNKSLRLTVFRTSQLLKTAAETNEAYEALRTTRKRLYEGFLFNDKEISMVKSYLTQIFEGDREEPLRVEWI